MIYLASYKGKDPFPTCVVSEAIRYVTHGDYSHSEVCIGNPFESPVICVTSAGQEGGVVRRSIQLSPDNFDLLPLPNVTETEVNAWYERNRSDKYDWIGCFRFIVPLIASFSPTRWFCSESAADIIGLKNSWRYSPSALHDIVLSMMGMMDATYKIKN